MLFICVLKCILKMVSRHLIVLFVVAKTTRCKDKPFLVFLNFHHILFTHIFSNVNCLVEVSLIMHNKQYSSIFILWISLCLCIF